MLGKDPGKIDDISLKHSERGDGATGVEQSSSCILDNTLLINSLGLTE